MRHPTFHGPVNIGSEEMVSINQLVAMIKEIAKSVSMLRMSPVLRACRG